MMINVMVRACLNQEMKRFRILFTKHIRNNACPRAKLKRKPNLTEPKSECSEVPKCGLNTRHDNREVTLTHLTQAQIWRSDK